MKTALKSALVLLGALVVGAILNFAIVMGAWQIIAPPPGVDVMDPESLAQSMHLFGPQHFLGPFLAHALGTLAAAFLAARFAPTKPGLLALVCGLFFLLGGVYNVAVLPGPTWFEALDLIVAYIPMAWLGYMLGGQREATRNK